MNSRGFSGTPKRETEDESGKNGAGARVKVTPMWCQLREERRQLAVRYRWVKFIVALFLSGRRFSAKPSPPARATVVQQLRAGEEFWFFR
jgi:hypothetical protein